MQIPYSKEDLFELGPQPSYTGRNLDEIAFPLGGIGTGSISLGGWGQLRDWEIINRPAKGFVVPECFFTLKTSCDNKCMTKVLQGPVGGSYVGDGAGLVPRPLYRNDLGHGFPHFRKVFFTGHFPIATVSLRDPDMPLEVTLEAFNPFVPLNDKDSGIPVAIFLYHFKNVSKEMVSATIFGNLTNIMSFREPTHEEPAIHETEGYINEEREASGVRGLYVASAENDKRSARQGSMALATVWPDSAVWPRWEDRATWGWVGLREFWETITLSNEFPPEIEGEGATGTVAANFVVKSGETVTIPFMIAWHFPNFEKYWGKKEEAPAMWSNYYAKFWKDAWDVALYVSSNLDRLLNETKLFHDTLFSSTFPIHIQDAVSSQLSTLRTNTCLRLEDGTFYGFEGCNNNSGCCEGSCTHVWNYAQALPYLFPNLQRSMIDAHFANCVQEDGFMTFRMPLPLGTRAQPSFHPAGDGQMGCVLWVYREWLISGDDEWLRSVWPTTKKILEFAWKYWDADRDGVMEGMQHNTYDIEFYGPNTMMGSLYLAALRAAEEIAEYLGEVDKAKEYRGLFENGSKWTDENLFNGEYYEQKVNPTAHGIWPETQKQLALKHGKDAKFTDWPKWQFGKGCLSDQMIGQWYAHMLGLGYLYDPDKVKKALKSVFYHNWKPHMWNHPCPEVFICAVNEEAGLITCTWPKGERPKHAFHYSDEVWAGIEYQVASHLIYEDMMDEGFAIVMGNRLRYRGDRRNPWDIFLCGHHYSREMASYALLLALSGYKYSAPEKKLRFSPKIFKENFGSFFSTATGWGFYRQKYSETMVDFTVEMRYGFLALRRLDLPPVNIEKSKAEANLDGTKIDAKIAVGEDGVTVLFDSLSIKNGQTLEISVYRCRRENYEFEPSK